MPKTSSVYFHFYPGKGEGDKPPIVLIHGAGGTHLYWPAEIRRLPGYRVYAIDLPGHGKSGGRGHQSILAYTEGLLDWMSSVGLHQAIFVGHSMGSAIAITLALEYPNQVLGLALVGAGARLRVAPELLENAANPMTFQLTVDLVVNEAFCSQTSNRLKELAAQRMAETRPSVLHGDFLACDQFDVVGRIPNISQPALVLCGLEDKLTPPRYSQLLAAQLPNATLKLISNAGHMVMLEHPQLVADALQEFLERISN